MHRLYKEEVLGRYVVINFVIILAGGDFNDDCTTATTTTNVIEHNMGQIRAMKLVMKEDRLSSNSSLIVNNGGGVVKPLGVEHLVVFQNGEEHWFDLVKEEEANRLTWINTGVNGGPGTNSTTSSPTVDITKINGQLVSTTETNYETAPPSYTRTNDKGITYTYLRETPAVAATPASAPIALAVVDSPDVLRGRDAPAPVADRSPAVRSSTFDNYRHHEDDVDVDNHQQSAFRNVQPSVSVPSSSPQNSSPSNSPHSDGPLYQHEQRHYVYNSSPEFFSDSDARPQLQHPAQPNPPSRQSSHSTTRVQNRNHNTTPEMNDRKHDKDNCAGDIEACFEAVLDLFILMPCCRGAEEKIVQTCTESCSALNIRARRRRRQQAPKRSHSLQPSKASKMSKSNKAANPKSCSSVNTTTSYQRRRRQQSIMRGEDNSDSTGACMEDLSANAVMSVKSSKSARQKNNSTDKQYTNNQRQQQSFVLVEDASESQDYCDEDMSARTVMSVRTLLV